MNKLIPFHIPFKSKKEIYYLNSSIKKNSLAGRGFFTKKCEDIFTKDFKKKCLMTTSCTHALEIIAFVLNLTNKDEVILPSLHISDWVLNTKLNFKTIDVGGRLYVKR